MNKNDFDKIEQHMLSFMTDSAHDQEHAYRVLYLSLDIAKYEKGVDYDVLIGAAMLHDIGRAAQFNNPKLCHGKVGGAMAKIFYNGTLGEPLYTKNPDGSICNDGSDGNNTFFTEYEFKLKDVYNKFYTKRAMILAKQRKQAAIDFYNSLVGEIKQAYEGANLLDEHIK